MNTISLYVDYARIAVVGLTIVLLVLSVVIPFQRTFIPYWKKFGTPSAAMFFRLSLRFTLLLLAIYNISFPIERVFFEFHTPSESLHLAFAIPIYLTLSLLIFHLWLNHPEGPRGL